MMKPLLTLLCSCAFSLAHSQDFTYSFSGRLSIDELERLKDSLLKFPITTHSIILKPELARGYLVFSYEAIPNGDRIQIFSLVDIKKILMEFELVPEDCAIHFSSEKL